MSSVPCSSYTIAHFPRRLAITNSGDMANDLMAGNKRARFMARVSTYRLAKMLNFTMACKLYMAIRRFW